MDFFSRIREKIKPAQQIRDPFGTNYRNITFSFALESWSAMSKESKREIVAWAKQNLWNDPLAYSVLVMLRNGELKV